MSADELRVLFEELADDVTSPPIAPIAPRAWARARRVRRRRAGIGATIAILLVSASIALLRPPDGAVTTPAVPSPTVSGATRIDSLPTRISPDPDLAPQWPSSLKPPANAPTVAQAPLSHAVLLFQPRGTGPVYAYGEGSANGRSGNGKFGWVRLEVALVGPDPVSLGSLGPMGELAAFAQPDEFVVVDLHTGKVQRTPLPGANEDLTWLPDGRHLLVSNATQTWLVGASHVVDQVAVPGAAVTPLVGAARDLTTLTLAPSGPLRLRRYDDEGRGQIDEQVIDMSVAAPYRVDTLVPRGWRLGNLTAQFAKAHRDQTERDVAIVVDDRPETLTHLLDLGGAQGCCAVLGWTGTDQVVVRTTDDVLLWRLADGRVTQAVENAPGGLSLNSAGCPVHVTIENVTTGCME